MHPQVAGVLVALPSPPCFLSHSPSQGLCPGCRSSWPSLPVAPVFQENFSFQSIQWSGLGCRGCECGCCACSGETVLLSLSLLLSRTLKPICLGRPGTIRPAESRCFRMIFILSSFHPLVFQILLSLGRRRPQRPCPSHFFLDQPQVNRESFIYPPSFSFSMRDVAVVSVAALPDVEAASPQSNGVGRGGSVGVDFEVSEVWSAVWIDGAMSGEVGETGDGFPAQGLMNRGRTMCPATGEEGGGLVGSGTGKGPK